MRRPLFLGVASASFVAVIIYAAPVAAHHSFAAT
jgi:hypothetical protein